jgi:hypothetical protein
VVSGAAEGERRRDDAIDRVDENAQKDWKDAARVAVAALASLKDTFTTDDVWKLLETQGYQTHEPRALGAVMRRAARNGLIESTDRTRLSERPECHRRPVRIWRSTCRV